ncbi:fimbrillin family protein [Parasphaerochaeta coccoides]|uniref:Uncharacterized protein n=1 Tax=Parasphaerochaeta coccoides (strain ATCC BAA-1237 / DSM 17374 / SPN1) TaxID=760011 RepID=F4GKA9_PARC1|nr:fimbrillin family protein [Parasphaerochaeta coccoides]AEC02305.1 hypothetical protein Spico_1084 [Parasphaerochaeta coccoides DSM 17374]
MTSREAASSTANAKDPINVYPLGSGEQDTGKADFLWRRTDGVQNNTSTVHLKLEHMFSRLIVNLGYDVYERPYCHEGHFRQNTDSDSITTHPSTPV